MRDEECRSDLLALQRRGQLSANQGVALDAHLASCESCRLTRTVFDDFAEDGAVGLRDGLVIQRLSTVARHRRTRPAPAGTPDGLRRARGTRQARQAPSVRQRQVMALAAALMLAGGSASAAIWWWRQPPAPLDRPNAVATAASLAAAATPRARGLASRLDDATPLVTPALSAETSPRQTASRAARRNALTDAGRDSLSSSLPSSLLRQAREAGRAGEAERAVTIYRKLQREFPRSPEAVLAAVPLGVLLLDRGLARAALVEFERYLASSGGGTLIPEALYGRGRALARLGDRDEELRTWQRLLADFPGSAYAPHGRRRSAELR